MQAQAKSGQLSAALDTAKSLRDADLQVTTLVWYLAQGEMDDNRGRNAQAVLDAAAEVVEQFDDESNREFWLSDIGKKRAQLGELDTVLKLVAELQDEKARSEVLAEVALVQAMHGPAEQALSTCERIFADRNAHLPAVAQKLADRGDKDNFKRMLVPCAYYLDASYAMCGLLARLYPQKAIEVVKQIEES
jgi:hypothetical protein